MKRWIELLLLVLVAAQSLELAWRRLAWSQIPPEVPLWAWIFLLILNGAFLMFCLRERRKEGSATNQRREP
jgi:hypothetical protein